MHLKNGAWLRHMKMIKQSRIHVFYGGIVQCLITWQFIPRTKGMDDEYNEEANHYESERLW